MDKYSIFEIQGGIGKHIAATAVAKCLKNNFPDRKLIVVCAWPSVFVNLPFVDRVYKFGSTPYFYQDFIKDKNSLIFKHEPYGTTAHVHATKPLIENWCELFNLEYKDERPELVFNLREKQLVSEYWASEKPVLLLHASGGMFEGNNGPAYKWTRDMPIGLMHAIAEEFRASYNILQVVRKNAVRCPGVTVIDQPLTVMDLMTILPASRKRILIDSCLQHGAAALGLPSNVLWVGTNPKIFGYAMHNNIIAKRNDEFKLPDSYLFDYNFEGVTHECPYRHENEMFDTDAVLSSLKSQVF